MDTDEIMNDEADLKQGLDDGKGTDLVEDDVPLTPEPEPEPDDTPRIEGEVTMKSVKVDMGNGSLIRGPVAIEGKYPPPTRDELERMNAVQILIRRTGMSEEDAQFYYSIAEDLVMKHVREVEGPTCCCCRKPSDLSRFSYQIMSIATLMWQEDKSNAQASAGLGYESISFQEGNVSRKETALTGSYIRGAYGQAISDVLAEIDDVLGVDTDGGLIIW